MPVGMFIFLVVYSIIEALMHPFACARCILWAACSAAQQDHHLQPCCLPLLLLGAFDPGAS